MRRATWPRVVGIAVPTTLLATAFAVWTLAFHVPASPRLALPSALIALDSGAGQKLLSGAAYVADYAPLVETFEPQSRPAYCGVASAVIVLNALRSTQPRFTQATFFTDAASKVRGSLQVTFGGMSLDELVGLLRAHGLDAAAVHGADTSLDAFRLTAQQNLARAGDLLLVNYQRAALGQEQMGHISPVAAYDAQTDRLLVLDVAAYKYPPVWVATQAMWQAMRTTDSTSGLSRGFVVVREGR